MNTESTSSSSYAIRKATADDIKRIPALEAAADTLFAQAGITGLPPAATKEELQQAKLLLVAGNPPVGFVRLEEVDGQAHLEQISVSPQHGGQGIGGALLEASCEWAAQSRYTSITLSTYKDIPWNAPFYARHGFEVLHELTPDLLAMQKHEATLGLDKLGPRVFMRRALSLN